MIKIKEIRLIVFLLWILLNKITTIITYKYKTLTNMKLEDSLVLIRRRITFKRSIFSKVAKQKKYTTFQMVQRKH